MKIWRVYYYTHYNTIAWKDVKAPSSDIAIKRARVKNIISLMEV